MSVNHRSRVSKAIEIRWNWVWEGNSSFRMNGRSIGRVATGTGSARVRHPPLLIRGMLLIIHLILPASITDNWQTPLSYKNVLLRFLCEVFLLLFSIIWTPSSTHSVFMPILSPNTHHSSGIHFLIISLIL